MILRRLQTALDRKLQRFLNKEYRNGYLETHVRTGIALQIRALRMKDDLSQEEFAVATGKKQSTISRLESTDYGRVSVQTLLDVAAARNVALLVRFVDYPNFLRVTADMSERALAPDNVFESHARAERADCVLAACRSQHRPFHAIVPGVSETTFVIGHDCLPNLTTWAQSAKVAQGDNGEPARGEARLAGLRPNYRP